MELGTLIRIKPEGDIYIAKQSVDGGCFGCAGAGKKALCEQLPWCYNTKTEPSVVFSKLTDVEAAKAIKSKKVILIASDL